MTPYPPIERWRLPEAACEQTRAAVKPAGRRGVESGVFWLGRRAGVSEITAVVHPIGEGVEETPFYWSVSPEVYAAVAAWANLRRLTLLAVAHIHLSAAQPRMSPTDRTQGLKVPDALAIILPRGGREPAVDAWGWFVYEDSDYRELESRERAGRVELCAGEVEFANVEADGKGVA
ncbi:MAG: hypothetical protein AABM30_03235 [Actinomycetota bacterium]